MFAARLNKGFTLIELMVVLTIIGILATVITVNVSGSNATSRDAKRQADLKTIQAAIELYKNKHGRYPAGCNGPNVWSGQLGTNYECTNVAGNSQFIIGHAVGTTYNFTEFMARIPYDPKLAAVTPENSGYMYWTNDAGTAYKLRAYRTVESERVTYTHPLKPCDVRVDFAVSGAINRDVIGWCGRMRSTWTETGTWSPTGGSILRPHPLCDPNLESFYSSYAVWGGFLAKRTAPPDICGSQTDCLPEVVIDTTSVICR